jgi:hypothetical protein
MVSDTHLKMTVIMLGKMLNKMKQLIQFISENQEFYMMFEVLMAVNMSLSAKMATACFSGMVVST